MRQRSFREDFACFHEHVRTFDPQRVFVAARILLSVLEILRRSLRRNEILTYNMMQIVRYTPVFKNRQMGVTLTDAGLV